MSKVKSGRELGPWGLSTTPGANYPWGMGGRAEPPEGAPEGDSGGEDEFRPVVFDESFVRAARIQELSAQERMSSGTRPVRRRGLRPGGLPRQALALMLLVSMAFAAAVYLGTRHPYPEAVAGTTPLSITVVPLQPGAGGIPTAASSAGGPTAAGSPAASPSASGVPSASGSGSATTAGSASASASASASMPPGPFAGTPLEDYAVGISGMQVPVPRHTADFSHDQVLHAMNTVLTYLQASSLDPSVLMGADTDSVRELLAPSQTAQFDASLAHPQDDQQHDVTGWLVRFDPTKVRLAAPDDVRVQGTLTYQEVSPGTLEVTSDHTFVYALTEIPAVTPTPTPGASSSTAAAQPPTILFTVRRELRYRFTLADLNANQLEIIDSVVQAGPMSCDADVSSYLQPLFPAAVAAAAPGRHGGSTPAPTTPIGPEPATTAPSVDPFDHTRPAWAVCGVMTGPTL